MTDLETITRAAFPRSALAPELARRMFPAKHFALFGVLVFFALTLLGLMLGSLVGIVVLIAKYDLHRHSGDGALFLQAMFGTLAFVWLIFGALILPSHVRSKRRPVHDVVRDGDLFDARLLDEKVVASLLSADTRREYVMLVERDGARIQVASPVKAIKVLHRLGTHVALAFDEHGAAHPARAWHAA